MVIDVDSGPTVCLLSNLLILVFLEVQMILEIYLFNI